MTTVVFCFVLVFAVAINAAGISRKGLGVVGGQHVSVTDYPYQAELLRSGAFHCGGSIISQEYILTAAHCAKAAGISRKGLGVVGGQPVSVTDYPYQAELLRSGAFHCGGSIISQEYILTAAHCGKAAGISRKGLGVVGGQPVSVTDYPYQAELLRSGAFHCGGSIISQEYILTAAHCVKDYSLSDMQVKIGSADVGTGGTVYDVLEGSVHPQYNASIYDYDVAVLKVTKKMFIDGKTTRIVKLADSGDSLKPGEYIKVSGWGKTEEGGSYAPTMRAVALPVLPAEKCKAAYEGTTSKFTTRMYCAGFPEGGKDACLGDSGGPAVHKNTLVQYGIVSWGRGCARKQFPGVYTAVPTMRSWIKQVSGV